MQLFHMPQWLFKVVPLIAPEYGKAAMKLGDSLGAVSMGFNEAPYVANAANNIATKVATALHFGSCGGLTTSSRYIAAENL